VYTDDNNTTHVGTLRFGDCDISVDNAKTSAQRENANLTCEQSNLTRVIVLLELLKLDVTGGALRTNIDWKSAFLTRLDQFRPKLQVDGNVHTNHFARMSVNALH